MAGTGKGYGKGFNTPTSYSSATGYAAKQAAVDYARKVGDRSWEEDIFPTLYDTKAGQYTGRSKYRSFSETGSGLAYGRGKGGVKKGIKTAGLYGKGFHERGSYQGQRIKTRIKALEKKKKALERKKIKAVGETVSRKQKEVKKKSKAVRE